MPYDQMIVTGPFMGVVDNLPRPYKPQPAWDDVLNWLTWKGRMITRPRLNAYSNTPNGATLRNVTTFNDVLGNLHTMALTTWFPYFLTSGPTWNQLTLPSMNQESLVGTGLPFGIAVMNGQLFFANGSVPGLYANGEASVYLANHPGTWRFAGVLGGHMVTAYTTEPDPTTATSTPFPQRVRWSNQGDPTNWTESAATSAGHVDLLEVPDFITGFATLGTTGYVYRTNGITMMIPTGIGENPFQFNQISNALGGVGCKYPYTLSTYGNMSAFVAANDIYGFDGNTLTPFGGQAKKRIFADIANASGDVITAFITPTMGPGFDFLSYWIAIPGVNVTWIYSYDDQSWVRFQSSHGNLTALSLVIGG